MTILEMLDRLELHMMAPGQNEKSMTAPEPLADSASALSNGVSASPRPVLAPRRVPPGKSAARQEALFSNRHPFSRIQDL